MKHNHPFTIGEKVWDDNTCQWATVSMFGGSEDEGSNFLVLKNDRGELRRSRSGDIVCYEHKETEDGYPYYCPELQENMFGIELVNDFDADIKDGTACELAKALQDCVFACPEADNSVPVFVEDENGRLENITHIWYDPTRHMIRLTVVGVEFNDAEED